MTNSWVCDGSCWYWIYMNWSSSRYNSWHTRKMVAFKPCLLSIYFVLQCCSIGLIQIRIDGFKRCCLHFRNMFFQSPPLASKPLWGAHTKIKENQTFYWILFGLESHWEFSDQYLNSFPLGRGFALREIMGYPKGLTLSIQGSLYWSFVQDLRFLCYPNSKIHVLGCYTPPVLLA